MLVPTGPWADYARAQAVALRLGRTDDRDLTPERVLDHILENIASGTAFTSGDLSRVRRSAARRDRARAALQTKYASPHEDDLRHRAPLDPEKAVVVSDAIRRCDTLDAVVLVLDAHGLGSAEIAAQTGLRADAIRQRLGRRRAWMARPTL